MSRGRQDVWDGLSHRLFGCISWGKHSIIAHSYLTNNRFFPHLVRLRFALKWEGYQLFYVTTDCAMRVAGHLVNHDNRLARLKSINSLPNIDPIPQLDSLLSRSLGIILLESFLQHTNTSSNPPLI
jgi:hypothetical protein